MIDPFLCLTHTLSCYSSLIFSVLGCVTMKFKKGDRVEVMNHVKYDSYLGLTSEQTGGTMSRMFIRPCPPLVPGADCYAAGNIVEVLHEYSWKTAAVLKVLEGKKGNRASMFHRQASDTNNQYLVRLLGHSEKLVVSKSNMRMAQTWHDDKWTLMGKVNPFLLLYNIFNDLLILFYTFMQLYEHYLFELLLIMSNITLFGLLCLLLYMINGLTEHSVIP